MRFTRFAASLLALSVATASAAQTSEPRFTPEQFRAHVTFLADDLLEGREAGTRGYEVAARYVATQFAALGLQPGNDGGWFQQVPFARFQQAPGGRLSIGDRAFAHGQDVIFRQSPINARQALEAPVVFAGYGLDLPAHGHNDYRGLDVRGKIVAVLSGYPDGTATDVGSHLNQEKRRMAEQAGAIGLITIRTRAEIETRPWDRVVSYADSPGMTWLDPQGAPYSDSPNLQFVATLNETAAAALFEGARTPLSRVLDQAARPGGRPRGFALRQTVSIERESANTNVTSPNVVAVLPGSDRALAGEYVLLMAHLDGLGIAPTGEGDRIRNGAMDNTTGVATLIEVARQMALPGNRPRRSILFAAVTAEEKGLLGAQYLARNPVVDGRVVGVVNLDMPVLTYDFTDVTAFGAEHSTMGAAVERAGARMNVTMAADPLPREGLFTRSDHYMFVREGIPSVFLMTGFANGGQQQFTDFLAGPYHSPADDLNLPFNWQAGAKFAELNYLIATEIANADQAPRWYSDSFFGNVLPGNSEKAERPAR